MFEQSSDKWTSLQTMSGTSSANSTPVPHFCASKYALGYGQQGKIRWGNGGQAALNYPEWPLFDL